MIPGPLSGTSLPGTGPVGAARTELGDVAAAECAAPFHAPATAYADALCEIARLVEGGLPQPRVISVDSFGEVVVAFAHAGDLPAWVIHLDLPAPEWHTRTVGDQCHRTARWPDVAFDGLLFRLSCTDTVPLNPEAPTCSHCVDLMPCDPSCELALPGSVDDAAEHERRAFLSEVPRG